MQQSLFGSLLAVEEPTVQEVVQSGETLLENTTFTVVDIETTGLNAKKNAITEITAIQFKNGEEIKKYSTLVSPTEAIPADLERLTGITNEMVKNAPALITVLTELCSFVGTSPFVVGHNVPFDIRFIQEKLLQSGLSSAVERFNLSQAFCTKALAVKAIPGLPSYQGIVVATQCGVINNNPHRAESDVRMSAGILFAIIQKLQQQGLPLRTVQDLLTYQGPLS